MKNLKKNTATARIILKSLLTITLILGLNIGAFAQSNITIGTGTKASEQSPINRQHNYSTHEIIYLSNEIGSDYYFTKIAFHKKDGANIEGIENVSIYMKHTTESTLTDGNYSLTGYTQVYSGIFPNNSTSGWMEVTLDQAFLYNGLENLQLLIIKGYQSKTQHMPNWSYTNMNEYMTRNEKDDQSQPTYLRKDKNRPNIRLECDNPSQLWVEIGTGTEGSEISPLNRKYNYSTSELIYTHSEIGRGYHLTKLAFHKKEGSNVEDIENVTIYFKLDTSSTFTDGNYSLDGYTQVYNGVFTNNAISGWMEVSLQPTFSYHGDDNNLHILIIKAYQSKITHEPEWSFTDLGESRARNGKDNQTQPTLLTANTERPNIRLTYDYTNPVELTSFTGTVKDRDVTLKWSTAVEMNNAGFEIERESANGGSSWTKIGFVKGNGTTNEPKNYSFVDKKLETGKYNYRLKQIDFNNSSMVYDLTNTLEVGVPKKPELSQNYPNPFNPVTKIDYNLPYTSNVTLKLYDITGKEIFTLVNKTQTAGFYTVPFDASKLSSGTYFYRIITNDGQNNYEMTKRMLLIK